MSNLEKYYLILVAAQMIHSQEEIWTGFQKKWPLWRMSGRTFIICEVIFSIVIISIFLIKNLPFRTTLMLFYIALMLANGTWHLMWAAIKKKYVPGLITAPVLIVLFFIFYFRSYA